MIVYGIEVEPYTDEEFIAWADSREWVLAKTMPSIPHFYTVSFRKGTWEEARERPEVQDYARALATIRENHTHQKRWGKKVWAYYTAGEYIYWAAPGEPNPTKDYHHLNRTYKNVHRVNALREEMIGARRNGSG
jgi:hypothetical protein